MQTDEIDVGTAAHPGDAPSANGANQALAVNSLAVGTHTQQQIHAALTRCDGMIKWYETHLTRARVCYRIFNTLTVVLAAATPVLILWQPPGVSVIWQAAPAALASLFATLIGSYRWREDWIRYAVAAETLRSERTKYTTRTTQDYGLTLTDAEAFDNFVYRVESLAISEVSEWRNQLVQKTNEPQNKDTGPQA